MTSYNKNAVLLKKIHQPDMTSYDFDFIECPDLAQTVVTFCAASGIELHCRGLQTLRIKETDRIAALDNELQKLSLASLTEMDNNNWKLVPSKLSTEDSGLKTVTTYEDHRMAMAFAPLTLKLHALKIAEPKVVDKSYPLFWEDLKTLGFQIDFI